MKHYSSRTITIVSTLILCSLFIFSFYLKPYFQQLKSVNASNTETLDLNNSNNDQTSLLQEPITILLLGLDNRKGDQTSRCDAIHMLTFSPPEDKITITSVPRNTWVDLPEVASKSAYLANVCEERGVEAGIKEIKRISNLNPNYIVKVNFSQTLGVLRLLGMPTTPTLQFLRDRTSYKRGGYQRSHNQALFIKDMILYHSEKAANLPTSVKKILFKMVDAGDLDFETANSILNWIVKSGLWQKPEKIELMTKPKPWYKIIEVHFSSTDYPDEDSWQDNKEFQAYQEDLKTYLEDLLEEGEKYLTNNQKSSLYQLLKTPFSQQLWLQLEDDQSRNQIHFDLLRLYTSSLEDKDEASVLIQDFVLEMETIEETELKNKAKELLVSMPE